jgi:type II secretory pathway component PulF
MPVYNYLARDRTGRLVRSQLLAASPVELRSRIQAMDIRLISFDSQRGGVRRQLGKLWPGYWLPAQSADIELALQQLAMMLRSGLKLLDAIKSLQLQTQRQSLARVLARVHQAVAQGSSLSDALAKQSVFPAIVVQMVHVGEQTGELVSSLHQSQEYLYSRRQMITEVRMALAYPLVVTTAAIAIAAYLVLHVIPQLQVFLSAMGRDLPAMTQRLIDLSQWLQLHGVKLVAIGSGLLATLAIILYTPRSRNLWDRAILRLPIIGSVLRLSGTATLSKGLAVMMHSGIRLVEALQIATGMQRNRFLANLLVQADCGVRRGQPLAPFLSARGGFTPILSSMVEVAERAGNMDQTLSEVAKLCDTELKAKVKRLSRMVEPATIVISGGIVGYVYIAFFVALMSAGGSLQ